MIARRFRALFQRPVYGPLLLNINVPPEAAKYIEAMVPRKDRLVFLAQCDSDADVRITGRQESLSAHFVSAHCIVSLLSIISLPLYFHPRLKIIRRQFDVKGGPRYGLHTTSKRGRGRYAGASEDSSAEVDKDMSDFQPVDKAMLQKASSGIHFGRNKRREQAASDVGPRFLLIFLSLFFLVLAQYNLAGTLIDVVNAPEPVKVFLCERVSASAIRRDVPPPIL